MHAAEIYAKCIAGDHVHLGPGVTAKRVTDPAVSMEELPPIDLVLLSHFHEGPQRHYFTNA